MIPTVTHNELEAWYYLSIAYIGIAIIMVNQIYAKKMKINQAPVKIYFTSGFA